MSVYIELVTDAFESVFREQARKNQGSGENRTSRAGRSIARRPVRGIEIKEDTYAYLKVVQANGTPLPLLDSSQPDGETTSGYTNFILQSVQEQRMEKHQIVETFGDSYIFFFGESPRFLNCTASLINTHDFNWRAEWWHNYENYLRGTKLVELGARCYMFWDDIVVEGYMMNAQAAEQSGEPYTVQLSFLFFVTKYRNIGLHNVAQYPLRAGAMIIEDPELTNAEGFARAVSLYRYNTESAAFADAVGRQQGVVGNQLSNGTFGSADKISTTIARNPAVANDPTIWTQLVGKVGLVDPDNPNNPITVRGDRRSVRGLIAENVDEYLTGGDGLMNPNTEFSSTNTQRQQDRQQFETDDLTRDSINRLSAIGADVDNPDCVRDLGLGPNFSPGYVANASAFAGGGIGAGVGSSVGTARAGATVSFSPLVDHSASLGVTAGARAGFGVGTSARAGAFANTNAGVYSGSSAYSSFSRDPLVNVYGRPSVDRDQLGPDRPRYVEGAGDLGYGYHSDFGGVGYGQAGHGDHGGNGFGSSNSRGDPGFRDPATFSFSGVSESRAAFDRFMRVRRDNTAITPGPVLGGVAATGQASMDVRGSHTSFALIAVDGDIAPWAVAEAEDNDGRLYFGRGYTATAYATAGIGI